MCTLEKEDITRFEADIVIHGAGRVPALDMNLEKGNIERKNMVSMLMSICKV